MNFTDEVVQWYLNNKRNLPWRNTTDPYVIWLSEIILQQTRVEQGMPYFYRFLEKYPDVSSFAAAHEDEILKLWQGLGYYSRGRNMLKTARLVQELHNGRFPDSYNELIKLKGIGEYTAAAIASFAANEAKAVVDGNVYRVLARYLGIYEPINSTGGKKTFQQTANDFLNKKMPGLHNQAMMEFGAMLCNEKGDITVKSDAVRQALDFYKKLMKFLPPDVAAWDDASNNKFLISGQASMIMNPPSAWAVAKRDAPQVAEQCWTHGFPSGPKGRYAPFLPFFWCTWSFSKNQSAAKSLLRYLSTADAAEKMVNASGGYDLPAFEKFTTFKVWAEAEPPKGTLYHYPNPHNHQILSVAAAPAPHKIAEQIYNQGIQTQMAVRYFKGEALEKTIDWASGEIEGFMRN